LDASTGATKWHYLTGGGIFTAPAIVGNVEYVGSLDNRTYALNAKTGAFIWSYKTGGNIYSSPAIVNGVAYFGSYDNNVYAIGQKPSNTATPTSTGLPITDYYLIGIVVLIVVIVVAIMVLRKKH
jgi:outer membrane protein assembly factor BamB